MSEFWQGFATASILWFVFSLIVLAIEIYAFNKPSRDAKTAQEAAQEVAANLLNEAKTNG